jgi:ubiquinone/menaquinone biosynthesis C-methylase UbiE
MLFILILLIVILNKKEISMNDRIYKQSPDRLWSKERIERLEIENVITYCLDDGKVNNILDIGCGSGLFAEHLVRKGLKVVGIDINQDMIDAAKNNVPEAEFLLAEAENLPFKDNSFDMVFLGLVLHEVNDFEKSLSEAFRVCRIKTVVLEWKYEVANFGPPIEHRLKENFINEIAKSVGFGTIKSKHLSHLVLYTFMKIKELET